MNILLNTTQATVFQWNSAYGCSLAPSMISLNVSNPISALSAAGCDPNTLLSVNENCCMIYSFKGVSNTYLFNDFTFGSSGYSYCKVNETFYVLADGTCINQYQCTTRTLMQYPDSSCSGSFISSNPQIVYYTPSSIYWTNLQPPSSYKLQYKTGMEIFSFICVAISIVGSIGFFAYFVNSYIKKRAYVTMIYAISNIIWLVSNLICMALLNVSGIDGDKKWTVYAVQKLFFNFATLSSIVIKSKCSKYILEISSLKYSVMMGLIICLHFGLLIGNYLMLGMNDSLAISSKTYYSIVSYSSNIELYWPLFAIFFNHVATVVSLTYIVNVASKTKKYSLFFAIRELASDRKLSALFATDFILFLGYFCLACIRTYSTLLRSDTNYYCSTGILQFIFFAHNCLMIIASIHYKAVLLRIVNKRKTKKTPKSMAPDIKDIASITASEMPTKKETFAVTVVEQHQVVDKKDSTVPRSVQTQETQ